MIRVSFEWCWRDLSIGAGTDCKLEGFCTVIRGRTARIELAIVDSENGTVGEDRGLESISWQILFHHGDTKGSNTPSEVRWVVPYGGLKSVRKVCLLGFGASK